LLCRRRLKDGSTIGRLMTGIEAMRAIGWDTADWVGAPECFRTLDDDLLRSLAGNAFSGYQIGPIMAASFASFAVPAAMLTIIPEVAQPDGEAEDSDDESS
jgi:hypothetical protein